MCSSIGVAAFIVEFAARELSSSISVNMERGGDIEIRIIVAIHIGVGVYVPETLQHWKMTNYVNNQQAIRDM